MEEHPTTQDARMIENSGPLLETVTTQVTDASLGEHDHFYQQPTPDTSGQEILLTLLTDSLPSQQRAFVNNEWSKDYLNRLTSLSLESLKHEPTLVKDEESKIHKELAELSFREYKSCIHANSCSTKINSSLDDLSAHLSELILTIPSLENACVSFSRQTTQISQQRNKINIILEQHESLLEILDIPQLMETCVRNGLYSEAMDLSGYVASLVSKYSTIPLIKHIEQEVKQTMQLMLTKLITLLSQQIKLPGCLKVIGYLRRMEAFNEAELQLVFLLSRDVYLQSLIGTLEKEKKDPVHYLKKYIDTFREHFFDIVTQYRSIFSDDGGGFSTASVYSSPTISPPSSQWSPNNQSTGGHTMTATTVFADYTVHILGQLTSALAEFTPLISDTSSLSSILTQLMYCGVSLGRVGIDFRHLVTGYFETAVNRIITKMIVDGTQEFCDDLKQAIKNVDLPGTWMIGDKKSTSLLDLNSQSNTSPTFAPSSPSSPFTPLVILLDYPPIAYLTNAYLSAFNSLRLVAPVSLFYLLGEQLSQNLLLITSLLRDYGDILVKHNHDITILLGFNAMFAQSFVPFISRCFVEGVYGGMLSGGGGGGSASQVEIIDRLKILDILKDFLPTPRKVLMSSTVKVDTDGETDESTSSKEQQGEKLEESNEKETKSDTINADVKGNEKSDTINVEVKDTENNDATEDILDVD